MEGMNITVAVNQTTNQDTGTNLDTVGSKRRRLQDTAANLDNNVVELVLESSATMTPVTMTPVTITPVAMAPVTITANNGTGCGSPKEQRLPNSGSYVGLGTREQRFVPFDHCKTEQIALLTALSQVVSCTQEAVKILRESQERSLDLEHKRFRFQLEAEEKRLMMESEHYRKMEGMFSGLIQAISQTPTPTPTQSDKQDHRTSPPTVKLEVET